MGLRRRKKKEEKKKQEKRQFSFFDKYSLPLGFLLFAGLLIGGYLPDFNPLVYLVLGPFLFRLLIDIVKKQTVGRRIIRTLHPKILLIDIGVMVGGLVALYMAGYWTIADLAPIVEFLNIFLEQVGYTLELPETLPMD